MCHLYRLRIKTHVLNPTPCVVLSRDSLKEEKIKKSTTEVKIDLKGKIDLRFVLCHNVSMYISLVLEKSFLKVDTCIEPFEDC